MRDLFGDSMNKLFGSTADVSWLCLNNTNPEDGESSRVSESVVVDDASAAREKEERRRKTRESAAKSKTGLWGPTHSNSSEDESSDFAEEKKFELDVRTRTTHSPIKSAISSQEASVSMAKSAPEVTPDEEKECDPSLETSKPIESIPFTLGRVWNHLQCIESKSIQENNNEEPKDARPDENNTNEDSISRQYKILEMFDEMCSPCKPKNLADQFSFEHEDEALLGISRMAAPISCMPSVRSSRVTISQTSNVARDRSVPRTDDRSRTTMQTPADRRRSRHMRRQLDATSRSGDAGANADPAAPGDSSTTQEAYEITPEQVLQVRKDPNSKSGETTSRTLPVESLELNTQTAVELERCISELTMRSSYGEATAKIAENRRMAYYAVGRHHRQSGRGGNRRCYFTGKLILGGAPFYAGSVQQGLRTLVVFCLPSAVGLPMDMERNSSPTTRTPAGSIASHRRPSLSSRSNASAAHSRGNPRSTNGSLLSRKGSKLSRLSSVDDTSVEEELDPNWELDKEYLLSILPEPTQDLLDEMAVRYPAQFETLPVQVRSPRCWKLYVKFCFFSGLPIAEGEMHYKVRDSLANQYGEEIILSHEVMEAVNGDSAEILRLPNMKTFRYLRKHYHQQSAKLPDSCFQRQAWEMVRPEV